MPTTEDLIELEHSLAEVASVLFAAGDVEATLQRIVDLAGHAVEGCEAAGIMLVEGTTVTTMAASSALVVRIDQLQIDTDEGPCVDASRQHTTMYAIDLLDEVRWPAFAPLAVDAGVRSVLAFSLSKEAAGALNLYASHPAAFGATDRAQGQLFATLARLAIDTAKERASDRRKLLDALRTRDVIGQAQGILMERDRISSEQAFAVLRRASQHMNVKLREVAQSLVDTGEVPT